MRTITATITAELEDGEVTEELLDRIILTLREAEINASLEFVKD